GCRHWPTWRASWPEVAGGGSQVPCPFLDRRGVLCRLDLTGRPQYNSTPLSPGSRDRAHGEAVRAGWLDRLAVEPQALGADRLPAAAPSAGSDRIHGRPPWGEAGGVVHPPALPQGGPSKE